jgi:hypothetical protein
MKHEPVDRRRVPVAVISLDNKKTVHSVFSKILDTNLANRELRRKIFTQIAKRTKLQEMILDVLAGHAEAQTSLLQELARIPQLRRELFALAHEATDALPRSNRRSREGV